MNLHGLCTRRSAHNGQESERARARRERVGTITIYSLGRRRVCTNKSRHTAGRDGVAAGR